MYFHCSLKGKMCDQRAADTTSVSIICVNAHMHLVLRPTEAETLHSHDGKDQGVLLLPFGFCTGHPVLLPKGVDHSLEPSSLGPGARALRAVPANRRKAQSSTQEPPGPHCLGICPPAGRKEITKDGDFSALTNV